MKILHHMSKATYNKHWMNYQESCYVDLPDGNVLVIGNIGATYIAALEKEATPLPFILTGEKLPANVVASLAHLGVNERDNTMTACLKLRTVHPAFHPAAL
jgi:hypothetical protein